MNRVLARFNMQTASSFRHAYPWALIMLSVLFSLTFLHNRPVYMSDTVTYVESAKSLAGGQGYTVNGSPVTIWPPGYSLALALSVKLGYDQIAAFKVLNILMAAGASLCFGLAFLKLFSGRFVWLVISATSFMFPWIYYSHAVVSEMLFTLLISGFCLGAVAHVQTQRRSAFWLMTFSAALAPVVRFAGVALFPVWLWCVFETGISRRSLVTRLRGAWIRITMGAVVLLLPFLLYLLRNRLLTGSWTAYSVAGNEEYLLSLARIGIDEPSLWIRLWVNIRGYWHIFIIPDQAGIARVGALPMIVRMLAGLPWILAAISAVRCVRSPLRPVLVLLVIYGGMLLLNSWYDMRYLVPVLPVLMLLMLDGAGQVGAIFFRGLFSAVGRRGGVIVSPAFWRIVCAVLLVAANFGFAVLSPQAARLRSSQYEGVMERFYNACLFLKAADGDGSIMVAGSDGFVPIWTGKPVVSMLSFVRDGQLHLQGIPDAVSYLLFEESAYMPYRAKYMEPWFDTVRDQFQLVFRENETEVWSRGAGTSSQLR